MFEKVDGAKFKELEGRDAIFKYFKNRKQRI